MGTVALQDVTSPFVKQMLLLNEARDFCWFLNKQNKFQGPGSNAQLQWDLSVLSCLGNAWGHSHWGTPESFLDSFSFRPREASPSLCLSLRSSLGLSLISTLLSPRQFV